jgi:CBS domain-containing protein
MTVAHVLAAKGRDVITAQPHLTLAEIAEVLVTQNIGAVVVADVQGNVLGLLSERDIIRAINKRGAAALADPLTMHMTRVVTTSEDERIHVVMEKMTNERFRHLPVMSAERLVGLVSIGDLVKYRLAECEYEHKAMREYIATA